MDEATILADLRKQFGKRSLLTDAEIAPFIGMSPKTQANRRSLGSFPLPVAKVGGTPFVSIYALATFLAKASGKSTAAEPTVRQEGKNVGTSKRQANRKTKKTTELAVEPTINRPPLGPQILSDLGL